MFLYKEKLPLRRITSGPNEGGEKKGKVTPEHEISFKIVLLVGEASQEEI